MSEYDKRNDYRRFVDENEDFEASICTMFYETEQSIEDLFRDGPEEYNVYKYECDTIQEIIVALLHYISLNNYRIKKCEYCGRYFITYNRTDEKYCYRKINGKDTCKWYMRKQRKRNRMSQNTVAKKYYSVYTNINNRFNFAKYKGKEEELYLLLNELSTGYRAKKGILSDEEMIVWLDTFLVGNRKNTSRF